MDSSDETLDRLNLLNHNNNFKVINLRKIWVMEEVFGWC